MYNSEKLLVRLKLTVKQWQFVVFFCFAHTGGRGAVSRKEICPVCHFTSWGSGWDYSKMSAWDMTLSLSQASTSQVKTKASFHLAAAVHLCWIKRLSSVSENENPPLYKKSKVLGTNGKLGTRRDLIFRSLCSQPVKSVARPSCTIVQDASPSSSSSNYVIHVVSRGMHSWYKMKDSHMCATCFMFCAHSYISLHVGCMDNWWVALHFQVH